MEESKEKAILPLDYDDDESSDEEEDEELFDNSKVDWRVKGNLLRGKEFSVSENGNCPRCQSNVIVFVILDELFPMGDMPEILYNLLAKGKAVLWSSQDKHSCKKSPTFMCRGFCPPDPLGAGFNINWDTVNLTKLLKDLLKLNLAKAQKKLQESEKAEENGGEDEDVSEKDIIKAMLAKEQEKEDEEKPVQGPLKEDETPKPTSSSEMVTTTSTAPVTITSSTTPVTSSAGSSATYPVSKDGSCPHCGSTVVRYIILVKDSTKDITLPPTLDKLLKIGKAFKMAKGANSPPSFQCCSCTYGFNLDWSKTNLKKIFKLDDEVKASSTTTTATSSTAVPSTSYQYQNYTGATSYPATSLHPATSYQTSSYGSYAYTQPPAMGYPTTAPYGYPGPAPAMGMMPPPPVGGMVPPQPYGAPMTYPGAPPQPYPGVPPQPYAPTPAPFMGPPQPYLGAPPNQFGLSPPGNLPPRGGALVFGMQPSMSGNMNFRGNIGAAPGNMQTNIPGIMSVNVPVSGPIQGPGPMMGPGPLMGPTPMMGPGPMIGPGPMQGPPGLMQGPPGPMQGPAPLLGPSAYPGNPPGPGHFPGNMQGAPRLRVPKGPVRGRNKNWKGKWKGKQGHQGNSAGQEQWSHADGESHEDEAEEGTSEDLYDPEAATRFEELLNKIDDHEDDEGDGDHEDEKPPGEETQAEFEVTAFTPDEKPVETAETIVQNTNQPEPTVEKVQTNSESTVTEKSTVAQQDVTKVSETKTNATNAAVVTESKSVSGNDSQVNDSQVNAAMEGESGGQPEASPAPRTKAARGRKRQATAGRKKTPARNTKAKKVVDHVAAPEDGVENNNDADGLTGTEDEAKKAKVDDELSQEGTGADKTVVEEIEEEAPKDTKPKRVTRARAQRRKK